MSSVQDETWRLATSELVDTSGEWTLRSHVERGVLRAKVVSGALICAPGGDRAPCERLKPAVSYTSPRAGTAVGSSASQQFAPAERWDGSTCKTQHVPDVNLIGYTRLTAVSCSYDSACMALGSYNARVLAIAECGTAARRG